MCAPSPPSGISPSSAAPAVHLNPLGEREGGDAAGEGEGGHDANISVSGPHSFSYFLPRFPCSHAPRGGRPREEASPRQVRQRREREREREGGRG